MSALQYRLLVRHHFIFLTTFPINNMKCSICCTATRQDSSSLFSRKRRRTRTRRFLCKNCVAGKQQHDCLSVCPDVEALSWLSVPCPSLVSSRAASVLCSAVYFPPIGLILRATRTPQHKNQ